MIPIKTVAVDAEVTKVDVLKKVPVREQDPKVRATNFEEVCLGYNEEEAKAEASRCLKCKNAQCMKGCPVSIHIPDFIKEGDQNIEFLEKTISNDDSDILVYDNDYYDVRIH